jgi:succinate dehydrogenase hydrophobic anchor subunit
MGKQYLWWQYGNNPLLTKKFWKIFKKHKVLTSILLLGMAYSLYWRVRQPWWFTTTLILIVFLVIYHAWDHYHGRGKK